MPDMLDIKQKRGRLFGPFFYSYFLCILSRLLFYVFFASLNRKRTQAHVSVVDPPISSFFVLLYAYIIYLYFFMSSGFLLGLETQFKIKMAGSFDPAFGMAEEEEEPQPW